MVWAFIFVGINLTGTTALTIIIIKGLIELDKPIELKSKKKKGKHKKKLYYGY